MVLTCFILTWILIVVNGEDQQRDLLYNVAFYGHLTASISACLICGYLFYARETCIANSTNSLAI